MSDGADVDLSGKSTVVAVVSLIDASDCEHPNHRPGDGSSDRSDRHVDACDDLSSTASDKDAACPKRDLK